MIQQPVTPEPYSPDKALAVFINANLTIHSYNLLRDQAKMQNCFIYPSYYKILQAKAECYPSKEDVNMTEYSAEINLQALLDLTVKRLFKFLENKILEVISPSSSFKITFKWGCDGSSNQSEYKQRMTDDLSDSDLFCISMVLLNLIHVKNAEETMIWENPVPSSTRFCR